MNLSVVIPVYNEEQSLPGLHSAMQQALSNSSRLWEVVYVNDGSVDRSSLVLEELAQADPEHVRGHRVSPQFRPNRRDCSRHRFFHRGYHRLDGRRHAK